MLLLPKARFTHSIKINFQSHPIVLLKQPNRLAISLERQIFHDAIDRIHLDIFIVIG